MSCNHYMKTSIVFYFELLCLHSQYSKLESKVANNIRSMTIQPLLLVIKNYNIKKN